MSRGVIANTSKMREYYFAAGAAGTLSFFSSVCALSASASAFFRAVMAASASCRICSRSFFDLMASASSFLI